MKIEYDPKEPERAFELLYKILLRFPLKSVWKDYENRYLKSGKDRKRFWENISYLMEDRGFSPWFQIKTDYPYFISNDDYAFFYAQNCCKILEKLPKILRYEKKLGSDFKGLKFFIEKLYRALQYFDKKGEWEDVLKEPANIKDFFTFFGIQPIENSIHTIESFRSEMNKIFDMIFGKKLVAIHNDGKFWFTDDTLEMKEQNKALSSLEKNKMVKVMEDIDKIRKKLFEKDFNEVVGLCRTTTEDFLKDFLLLHNINSVSKKKEKPVPIQEDTLKNLCEGCRKNQDKLFKFPSYLKISHIKDGYDKYFQVISNIIGGITNDFSHGKGSTHKITASELDATTTFGFVICMINTLLAYQK